MRITIEASFMPMCYHTRHYDCESSVFIDPLESIGDQIIREFEQALNDGEVQDGEFVELLMTPSLDKCDEADLFESVCAVGVIDMSDSAEFDISDVIEHSIDSFYFIVSESDMDACELLTQAKKANS